MQLSDYCERYVKCNCFFLLHGLHVIVGQENMIYSETDRSYMVYFCLPSDDFQSFRDGENFHEISAALEF